MNKLFRVLLIFYISLFAVSTFFDTENLFFSVSASSEHKQAAHPIVREKEETYRFVLNNDTDYYRILDEAELIVVDEVGEKVAEQAVNYRTLSDSDYKKCKVGNRLNCDDNTKSFTVALIVAVVITVLVETIAHVMEHKTKSPVGLEILHKVYRELMLMGFISFSLTVLQSTPLFEIIFQQFEVPDFPESKKDMVKRRIKLFEIAHISLFAFSMAFVLIVVAAFAVIKNIWKKWKVFDKKTEKEAIMRYAAMKERLRRNKLNLLNPIFLYKLSQEAELNNYWAIKLKFIYHNQLPKNFGFYYYLKRRAQRLFIEMVEVNVWLWVVLILGNLVWLAILTASPEDRQIEKWNWIVLSVIGGASFVLCFFAFVWLRVSYSIYISNQTLEKEVQRYERLEQDLQTKTFEELDQELQENHSIKSISNAELSEALLLASSAEADVRDAHRHKVWQNKYFICFSPFITFLIIQASLMFQCLLVSLLLVHTQSVFTEYGFITFTDYSWLKYLFMLPLFIPAVVVACILFPLVVPPFVILSSVGNLTSAKVIKMVNYLSHKHKFYRKVHSSIHDAYFASKHDHHSYVDDLYHADGIHEEEDHHHHQSEKHVEHHHH